MSKSVREDPAGGEQPGPKKQSKLLDCMQKIMLEMSVAAVMDLNSIAVLLTK